MCGIAGVFYYDSDRLVQKEDLKRMTDTLTHRGPDDDGYFFDGNVGLGFRRLSIIDLKLGHQPLSDSSGRFWITFNGEIYNYRELRQELISKGVEFSTHSDTEVLVNLYAHYGEKCLNLLRGMFSFVIWDKQEREIFAARDRFGIKPFYYFQDHERFIWGSELKSLKESKEIPLDIDECALDYYFAYGYSPRDKSIFRNIRKLEPGTFLKVSSRSPNQSSTVKYWSPDFRPDYAKTKDEWQDALYNALDEAVKLRLRSDVPLGAFLSGGIDSSIVVALMSLNSGNRIKTYSIGFEDQDFNELKYARILAEKYNTEHNEFIVEPQSIELLPDLVRGYDEPFADDSAIPTYLVSKHTSDHVTVALSGDGGDELFAGYNHYAKFLFLNNFRFKSPGLFRGLNKMLPDAMFGKGLTYYLSKDSKNIGAYFCLWKDYERSSMYNRDFSKRLNSYRAEDEKLNLLSSVDYDFLSKHQWLDINTFMVDDILTKVDIASMMNSLEVRVPILDHHVAELSFKMPVQFKMNGSDKKHIFKKSFEHLLPEEILTHQKQGFAVPMRSWFKNDFREYAHEKLLYSKHLYDYIDRGFVEKLLRDLDRSNRNFGNKIWSLLVFDEWIHQNK